MFFRIMKSQHRYRAEKRWRHASFSAGHWQWIAFLSWAYLQLAPLTLYGNKTSQLHQQH